MKCGYCHTPILGQAFTCPGCRTDLHLDCARDAGACPVVGCGAGPTEGVAAPASAPAVGAAGTPMMGPPATAPGGYVPSVPGPVGPTGSWSFDGRGTFGAPPWSTTTTTTTSTTRNVLIAIGVVVAVLVLAAITSGPDGPLVSREERRATSMAELACDEIEFATRLEAVLILGAGLDVAESEGVGDLFIDALWSTCPAEMSWLTS